MRDAATRREFVAAGVVLLAGCSGSESASDPTTDATPSATTAPTDTETKAPSETTTAAPSETTTTTRMTTDSSDTAILGAVEQLGSLALSSPAFEDGGPIPRQYGYRAQNVNPPLSISGVPEDAATLTLAMDDPDAEPVAGRVWLHWLVWNVPASTTDIPEDWTPAAAVEGVTDFDERGYGGPAPPDREHTYRFKLWALDAALDLPADASAADVGEAMRDHVLARTQLTGTYAPE